LRGGAESVIIGIKGGDAMAEMKYTAKDSVFSFVFRQPENTR